MTPVSPQRTQSPPEESRQFSLNSYIEQEDKQLSVLSWVSSDPLNRPDHAGGGLRGARPSPHPPLLSERQEVTLSLSFH